MYSLVLFIYFASDKKKKILLHSETRNKTEVLSSQFEVLVQVEEALTVIIAIEALTLRRGERNDEINHRVHPLVPRRRESARISGLFFFCSSILCLHHHQAPSSRLPGKQYAIYTRLHSSAPRSSSAARAFRRKPAAVFACSDDVPRFNASPAFSTYS